MENDRTSRKKRLRAMFLFGSMVITVPFPLSAAERIHTAYFSPAPGASAVNG